MTAAASPTAANPAPAADPTAWHALSPEEALRQQGVEVDRGLTTAEADARRAKVGPNTFAAAKKVSRATLFLMGD
jgi:Ca2+-transporting ATPase